jgi:hypothetical protein
MGTWELEHIKEHVKLYILLGGRFFLRGFGIVGAGVWKFLIGISKFLAGKPTSEGNGASHRRAMDMGVGAYSRECPTTYSDKRLALFNEI